MRQVRLLPYWLGSMLFFYQLISPFLNLKLGIRLSPDRLIFIAIMGFFIVNTAGRRRMGLIEVGMLAFTLFCCASWVHSGSDNGTVRLRWLNTIFQLTFLPYAAYYVAKNSEFTDDDIQHLFKGILIVQIYLVGVGLAQHFHLNFLVRPQYILDDARADQRDRVTGPFSNSSMMGGALVMNTGFLMLMTLSAQGRRKLYLNGLVLLSAACIYLTGTRTVWLGFFVLLVVFYFSGTELKIPARRLGVLVFLLALSGAGTKLSFYDQSLFTKRMETVQYRLVNLEVGIHTFLQHPILGVGYGNFNKDMGDFASDTGVDSRVLASGNENTWLGILVETGLVGAFLYAGIYLLVMRSTFRILRGPDWGEPLLRPLAAIGFALMLYMLANMNTGDIRFHLYDPCLAFLTQGLLVSVARRARENYEMQEEEANGMDSEENPALDAGWRLNPVMIDPRSG